MKHYIISNVCRVAHDIIDVIANAIVLVPGKNEIPDSLIAFRQIDIHEAKSVGPHIACMLKEHRGTLVPVLARSVANELIRDRVASAVPQQLLVYDINDYIADNNVQTDAAELERATTARADGALLVVVAMIGDNRSALSVCRNIVSGCQNMDTLHNDAAGAISASNTFLVE